MKEKLLLCSIAVLFGGCPNRHTGPRVVYVPAAPPAASSAENNPKPQPSEAMVIEVPQPPPQPQILPPAPTPPPEPEPQPRKHILRTHSRPNEVAPEEEPADIPTLELGGTSNQDSALHDQVVKLQQEVEQRIKQVQESKLSRTERNTLAGARAFLGQSVRALQESDLRRALNLANKANLLAQALLPAQ